MELKRAVNVCAIEAGWESTASTKPTARPMTTATVTR